MSHFELRDFSYYTIAPFQLRLEAGETVSLSGPSGSGKTLLLRALCDLDPHRGEVLLEGVPCSETEPHLWRRRVGFLPAESSWWYDTVGEHFPLRNGLSLSELGFDAEVLSWDIHRLSAGEKQRLSLLRLLANRPRVLLLDEPTANLDAENRDRVEWLLTGWLKQQGCAVIWVTHDPAQRRRIAKRHYDIVAGRLQEVESL